MAVRDILRRIAARRARRGPMRGAARGAMRGATRGAMRGATRGAMRGAALAVALAVFAGAATVGALAWAAGPSGAAGAAATGSSSGIAGGLPRIVVDTATKCIDEPAVMRRTHMNLLRHQRDRTMRQGIRGESASLNACIDCHAGKGAGAAAGSVIGKPEAFCETCHSYAAVKIDCFDCHQPRPAGAKK